MTPVAPVRCPPCETCGQAATGMGISEMRLRGSGNTVHALYAWGRPPCHVYAASWRCLLTYADRGSGYTGPYGLGGEALFGCSLTAVLRTRETFITEVRNRRAAAGDRPCRGHPLGLGVARTRTTRAVADGSTVPLFLCTESFRELF